MRRSGRQPPRREGPCVSASFVQPPLADKPAPLSRIVDASLRRPGGRRSLSVLATVLFLAGVGMFMFPFATNLYSDYRQNQASADFNNPNLKIGYQDPSQLKEGEGLTKLHIPSIDLEVLVVQGTSADALRAGAGHYTNTPLPCADGNVAIAGHRTTFRPSVQPARRAEDGFRGLPRDPDRTLLLHAGARVRRSTRTRSRSPRTTSRSWPTPGSEDPHADHVQPEGLRRAAPHRALRLRAHRAPLGDTEHVSDGSARGVSRSARGRRARHRVGVLAAAIGVLLLAAPGAAFADASKSTLDDPTTDFTKDGAVGLQATISRDLLDNGSTITMSLADPTGASQGVGTNTSGSGPLTQTLQTTCMYTFNTCSSTTRRPGRNGTWSLTLAGDGTDSIPALTFKLVIPPRAPMNVAPSALSGGGFTITWTPNDEPDLLAYDLLDKAGHRRPDGSRPGQGLHQHALHDHGRRGRHDELRHLGVRGAGRPQVDPDGHPQHGPDHDLGSGHDGQRRVDGPRRPRTRPPPLAPRVTAPPRRRRRARLARLLPAVPRRRPALPPRCSGRRRPRSRRRSRSRSRRASRASPRPRVRRSCRRCPSWRRRPPTTARANRTTRAPTPRR